MRLSMTNCSGRPAGPVRARIVLSVSLLSVSLLSAMALSATALSLLCGTPAAAAPLASGLGPEVALAEPRDGFIGSLNVAPENGPAGTPLTITAEKLPPNQEFQLVWRTV